MKLCTKSMSFSEVSVMALPILSQFGTQITSEVLPKKGAKPNMQTFSVFSVPQFTGKSSCWCTSRVS